MKKISQVPAAAGPRSWKHRSWKFYPSDIAAVDALPDRLVEAGIVPNVSEAVRCMVHRAASLPAAQLAAELEEGHELRQAAGGGGE